MARWRDDIAALAAQPNVVAKHSGLGMPLLGAEVSHAVDIGSLDELRDKAAPLIEHLHACFGSDRTMWASNYPIDKPGITIPASVQILAEVLGSRADYPKLLRDVAARTYHIQTTPADLSVQNKTANKGSQP